jgi:hypothetical protein
VPIPLIEPTMAMMVRGALLSVADSIRQRIEKTWSETLGTNAG